MKFESQAIDATLLGRRKRFFGDVLLNGGGKTALAPQTRKESKILTVHIPNTGSLRGALDPPQPCRILYIGGKTRKLPYSLEMLRTPQGWAGVNTLRPNQLIKEAWEKKALWPSFPHSQGEVRISPETRIDRVFWKGEIRGKLSPKLFEERPFHFVEVKNVTLAEGRKALFPDTPSRRGQKHLRELRRLLERGHSCEAVYVIQRGDCRSFSPADHIDEIYGKEFRAAVRQGMAVSAYPCRLNKTSIDLKTDSPLKIEL